MNFTHKHFTPPIFIFTFTLIISAILTGCCQIDDENTGEPAKCTLTYNANGGSGEMKSTTGNKGSEITLAANAFTRTGYTFAEWNTKSSGKGEKYADTAKIKLTANTTLYAQWTKNGYKIIYQPDGGTNAADNPTNYTIEDSVKLKAPSKNGYTFGGWYKAEDFSGTAITNWKAGEKTEDVTLYAKWTANTYTVKFDKNANDATGDAPADIQATYDVEFELPENTFTKIGYNFAGWNTKADGSGDNYEANEKVKNLTAENGATVTLFAKWADRGTHKITYELNGGSHVETSITSFKETEDVTLGTAERTGYTFSGWYEAEDFSGTAITNWKAGEKTEDVTLYAKWNANNYTVKFDKNADDATGDAPADISATYDKDFELPENTFAKIGYNFAGWNTKSDGNGTNYEANAKVKNLTAENGTTVTLYAQWSDRGSHKITYELNGGNHSGTQIEQFKETEDITLGTAERTGYTFSGWYETEDFSGTAVTSWKAGEKTEDVTLYAKWIAIVYTITYNLDGGTNATNNPTSYTIEDSITLNAPTKSGFTFLGWYTDSKFENKVTKIAKGSIGEKTLYTQWWNSTDFVKIDRKEITGTESWTPTSKIFISGRALDIKAFYISDHEVTRAEYIEIMGSAPKEGSNNNNPINFVSWYDTLVYCNKRSMKEGLSPCYAISDSTDPDDWGDVPTSLNDTWDAVTCDFTANGYRLPTEAEWEWAARGGENYKYAGSDNLNEVAWARASTKVVKLKKANGYRLYDMSGNVWEWCWDWNSSISSSTPAAGASSGSVRSLRGGCNEDTNLTHYEITFRGIDRPHIIASRHGLRVVRTAEE